MLGCARLSSPIFPLSVRLAAGACVLALSTLNACRRHVDEPPPAQELQPAPQVPPSAAAATVPGPSASTPRLAVSAASTAWPEGFRFAVIGDFGDGSAEARRVSELVHAFHPEIVITVGDNNYPTGAAETIDRNVGQFYSDFIGAYHGRYGKGAPENRFFPALGNHDWYTDDARPYLDYFTLPGNERYYSFSRGPIDFFALDSDPHEPDGTNGESKQATWLKAEAAKAHGAWQIAYMHHPPYSSGPHGSTLETEWPYHSWGIDLVLAGHDHTYERAIVDGVTFLVNGLGGAHEYEFHAAVRGSLFRYQEKHGAQLAVATKDELRITFVNVDGVHIDEVVLKHEH
jgi:tartrate-resistant acid phosphatase type 5